jgi:hypothetical protein
MVNSLYNSKNSSKYQTKKFYTILLHTFVSFISREVVHKLTWFTLEYASMYENLNYVLTFKIFLHISAQAWLPYTVQGSHCSY